MRAILTILMLITVAYGQDSVIIRKYDTTINGRTVSVENGGKTDSIETIPESVFLHTYVDTYTPYEERERTDPLTTALWVALGIWILLRINFGIAEYKLKKSGKDRSLEHGVNYFSFTLIFAILLLIKLFLFIINLFT